MARYIGNIGSICDRCHTITEPFEKTRIMAISYLPGPNHDNVSSDIKQITKNAYDLCPACYSKFNNMMEQFLKTSK